VGHEILLQNPEWTASLVRGGKGKGRGKYEKRKIEKVEKCYKVERTIQRLHRYHIM
jgi:hypothetical protein